MSNKICPALLILGMLAAEPQAAEDSPQLAVGVGEWAIFDHAGPKALHLSYFHRDFYTFTPALLLVVSDEGEQYAAVGVNKTFLSRQQFSLGIGFHAGYTDYSSLGYDLEFYSNLHLDYQLSRKLTVRTEIGHISNGGLGDTNPGSESAVVSLIYSLGSK